MAQTLTQTPTPSSSAPRTRPAPVQGRRRGGLLSWLLRWDRAWRQQRGLERLSAHDLRDIGMSPEVRGALTLRDLAERIPPRSW